MIAFGVTATILFLGTYTLSVRHVFEPSPKALVASLRDAGYDPDAAKTLVAIKAFSIPTDGWLKLNPSKP